VRSEIGRRCERTGKLLGIKTESDHGVFAERIGDPSLASDKAV